MNPLIKTAAAVRFRREIIDAASGLIVSASPWARNLILDGGLDLLSDYELPRLFGVLVLGTGATLTKRDSGTVTAALAGTTVTASGSFFEAADVGRTLKFDSVGTEYRVIAFTSDTSVQVAKTGTVAAQEFTLWYGNETTHGAEFDRVSTYATDAGFCQSTFSVDTWTHRRTFLSAVFTVGKLVTEVGWSYSATPGAPLFGRALVPGGGDYVAAGQMYRVQVEIANTYSPITPQAAPNVCPDAGFSTAGQFQIESVYGCATVNSTGGTSGLPTSYYRVNIDPTGYAFWMNLSGDSSALEFSGAAQVPCGFATNRQGEAGASAYVPGSCVRTYWQTFGVNEANDFGTRAVFLTNGLAKFARHLFTANQFKDNLHTLTFGFSLGWGRVLAN